MTKKLDQRAAVVVILCLASAVVIAAVLAIAVLYGPEGGC